MLRLVFRYIFREILTSSVLGTLLATFVIFLQKIDRLFEVLVGGNPEPKTIALLFAYTLPPVLPLTIPFGVLVGILIGLGRMASDGEIVAMRAAGVSSRKVIAPVLLFAVMGAALAAASSLRLTPYSIRESTRIVYALMSNQISAEIQERIFDENFPNNILYVGNVRPGSTAVWDHVFLANLAPPETRPDAEKIDGPLITVARSALATSDPRNNRVQLVLRDWSSHEMAKDATARDTTGTTQTIALEAEPRKQSQLTFGAMNTRQLVRYTGPDGMDASIELH